MANTVSQLDNIVRKKRKLEEDPKLTPGERQERIKNLTMDGCPIEDLGLDFTLPGYPNIELRKGGKQLIVIDYLKIFTNKSCLLVNLRNSKIMRFNLQERTLTLH